MDLIMAVKSALRLVVRGREICQYQKHHLYCIIELFLLLRGKLFAIDDQEIQSLMLNEWELYSFIQGIIQALMPLKTFGGYQKNYYKEIEVLVTVGIMYMLTGSLNL